MQIHITARHIELTPALSDYARKKIEKAQKFFGDILRVQAILSVQKVRHIAEMVVHMPGQTFRVEGEAGDLYAAIDQAVRKLDLHLKKVKGKRADFRNRKTPKGLAVSVAGNGKGSVVVPVLPLEAGYEKFSDVSKVSAKWISIDKALREIDALSKPFFLFVNEDTNRLNVIYKRSKNGYGLVEVEDPHF